MKQTLLLMVLALGMCSINVSAQTKKSVRKTTTQTKQTLKDSREYQVGEDGFEWYKICKNGKFGAEDKNGNVLVPIEYSYIRYQPLEKVVDFTKGPGFEVKMGNYYGFYNRNGECIIPFSRNYISIGKYTISEIGRELGTFYHCKTKDQMFLCDIHGKVVAKYNKNTSYGFIEYGIPYIKHGKMYFSIWTKDNLHGLADGNGNLIINPIYKDYIYISSGENEEIYTKNPETGEYDVIGSFLSVNSSNNPLLNNPIENQNTAQIVSKPISPSGNTTEGSTTGSQTQTIIVKHHRDPMPVQEWQQCTNCWGEGKVMCLGACGGTGTYYVGDRLHICNSCGGTGKKICPYCGGQGGKNVTVYR